MAKAIPAAKRKAPPLHPGAVVADILDGQRLSVRAAAVAIGLSHTALDKVLKGISPVTVDTALRLEAYVGSTAEHWLRMQADHDLWHARQRLAAELRGIKPLPQST
jgi:addiction module HigA family antidote